MTVEVVTLVLSVSITCAHAKLATLWTLTLALQLAVSNCLLWS